MFLKELSQYSLQSLRVYSYVASLGSVAEAAAALGLTQPAVSLQIHNLEGQLGFALFERQGRKNVLTARGKAFLQRLLPDLEHLEQVLTDARQDGSMAKDELSMGAVEGIGEFWLWDRFKQFSEKRDGLRFVLELAETEELEDRLLTGQVSAIITGRKFEHPRIVSEVFMDEKMVPVGKKKHIKALKDIIEDPNRGPKFWQKIPWLGYGDSSQQDRWAGRWLDGIGITVDRRFIFRASVNSYSIIRQMLLSGDGICVAPNHVCAEEIKNGTLEVLESKKYPPVRSRLYLSYRQGSLNKIHVEFKEWLMKAASQSV